MIKLNSTCKGRSNAKGFLLTYRRAWRGKQSRFEMKIILVANSLSCYQFGCFFYFVFCLRFDKSPRRFLQFLTLYAWSAFISLLLLWRLSNKKKKRSEQQVKCQAWQVCDFILPLVPSNLRKQRRIITCKRCATKWALILLALLLRHILQST